MSSCGSWCVAYADDLLLIVEGQSQVEIERKGTEWMGIMSKWGEDVGVCVSKGKMTILLKGSMAASRRPCVRMNGKLIRYAEYLGVSVSERMYFKVHFKRMRVKITNVIGQMKCVMKSEWDMRKHAMRIVYKGLFVACVMYGSSVCCEYMRSKYARDIMNRCQRVVLYGCLNVCKIVSTDAIQVLMGVLPRDLECMRTGLIRMIVNEWSKL